MSTVVCQATVRAPRGNVIADCSAPATHGSKPSCDTVVCSNVSSGSSTTGTPLGCRAPVFALVHHVLVRAREAGQIPQQRHLPVLRLGREIERESHVTPARLGGVRVDLLDAAECLGG